MLAPELLQKVKRAVRHVYFKTQKSIGNLQKMIKAELADEIKEIDGILKACVCQYVVYIVGSIA
jgi:hypothetical protein